MAAQWNDSLPIYNWPYPGWRLLYDNDTAGLPRIGAGPVGLGGAGERATGFMNDVFVVRQSRSLSARTIAHNGSRRRRGDRM